MLPVARSRAGLRFPLFGIPVTIDVTFIIFAVLFGFTVARSAGQVVALTALVFVSILFHELGHAAALAAFGHRSTILIHGFGGLTSSTEPIDLDDGQSIIVSLAGPFAGILLGLGVLWAAPTPLDHSADHQFWRLAIFINLLWSVANLVPILPLDGGHVMERLVHVFAPRLVDVLPHVISLAVALPIVIVAARAGLLLAAAFVALFAIGSVTALADVRKRSTRRRADEAALVALDRYRHGTDVDSTIHALNGAVASAPSPELLDECRASLAWALTYRDVLGDRDRVEALISALAGVAGRPTAFLSAAIAWRAGQTSAAHALWTRALAHEQTPPPDWYFPRLGVDGVAIAHLVGWLDQLPAAERELARSRLASSLMRAGLVDEARSAGPGGQR